ncbi:MAG TPA: acylphosphatase [Microvirga sp.]|jgi:acylphosphatase|nr:acylphosphatase [Microvirga sp.]
MESNRVVHVIIRGRVQGVGFRAWTQHQAELRSLEGWVRNRRDGTVEALLSGPDAAVEAMLNACRQGPAGSRVERVETGEADLATVPRPVSGRFEVLRTL